MIKDIVLPDLGEGIEGAEVSEVSVSVGDKVMHNQTILVLESDKASMEIPAEANGIVIEIFVSPGEELKPGQALLKLEVADGEAEETQEEKIQQRPPQEQPPSDEKETQKVAPDLLAPTSVDGTFASPGVRRLARELNINLETINGSGPKGRVTKDDLNGYIRLQMAISSGSIPAPKKEIDFSQWGEVEVQKLTKIKKITGERLQQAWQTIPHVTQFDEADITDLDECRKALKLDAAEKGIKVTFLPFLMKAAIRVLKEMPIFNSSLDHTDQNLVLKNYYHIGVAVDTPSGLTVPIVRDVDKKTVVEISEELMDLSVRARDKKLKPEEMKGATFTISSLGGIGGTFFTPIVNPPEVAILGVSKSSWKKLYDHKTKTEKPRYIMPFSLSYDHRVIDGAAAAAFTSRFAETLSDTSIFKD